eukprot:scaffold111222_cov38-Prasinocladus_malaysianus.AAC.1
MQRMPMPGVNLISFTIVKSLRIILKPIIRNDRTAKQLQGIQKMSFFKTLQPLRNLNGCCTATNTIGYIASLSAKKAIFLSRTYLELRSMPALIVSLEHTVIIQP